LLYWTGCSAYDNEAHQGAAAADDNWSNDSDDEQRYTRSVLEKRLAASAPATAVVDGGSQHSSLKTAGSSTSPGDSLRSTASSVGSAARHKTTSGKRQSPELPLIRITRELPSKPIRPTTLPSLLTPTLTLTLDLDPDRHLSGEL